MSEKDAYSESDRTDPSNRYGYTIPDKKVNMDYKAVSGEQLPQYVQHMVNYTREVQNTAYTHIRWHTHKSAGNCFICDLITLLDYANDIAFQCSVIYPKLTFSANSKGLIRLTK